MDKKRNGLLEIYRLIICFWPLYYHNFFFWERDYSKFTICELAVDFFFMLSGFFLMRVMRREKDKPAFKGMIKLMLGRVKPMVFSMCFIAVFNLICILLFIKGDYVNTLFELFKYWWFILYLSVAIGLLYLIYRILKSEKIFVIFLILLAAGMAYLHYCVMELGMFGWMLLFFTRTFGCLSAGVLLSYIPSWKNKKHNPSILMVLVLIPTLLYFAYIEKDFFIALAMIFMFGALVYFSTNISVGGAAFDFIGKLSVRIYLYMAFITMLYLLGLANHRVLFLVDLSFALIDTVITSCIEKHYRNKKKAEKTA